MAALHLGFSNPSCTSVKHLYTVWQCSHDAQCQWTSYTQNVQCTIRPTGPIHPYYSVLCILVDSLAHVTYFIIYLTCIYSIYHVSALTGQHCDIWLAVSSMPFLSSIYVVTCHYFYVIYVINNQLSYQLSVFSSRDESGSCCLPSTSTTRQAAIVH